MAKIIKSIKERLTPPIVHEMHRMTNTVTILWVSVVMLTIGFGLALVCMYTRILVLEQAIAVLATR